MGRVRGDPEGKRSVHEGHNRQAHEHAPSRDAKRGKALEHKPPRNGNLERHRKHAEDEEFPLRKELADRLNGHLAAAAQAAEGHRGAERGFACPTQHSHEKDVGHRHRNATRRNGCAGAEGIKENTYVYSDFSNRCLIFGKC